MHLFLGLSGSEHVQELVKQCMNSQAFWTNRTNAITGKKEEYKVQGVWRPIEFGHYVFPEEKLNEVLNMLSINPDPKLGDSKLESPHHIDKYVMILRKLLNLKKIPSLSDLPAVKKEEERTIFWHQHMNIIPIGIKEDGRGIRKFGDGSIFDQEWL